MIKSKNRNQIYVPVVGKDISERKTVDIGSRFQFNDLTFIVRKSHMKDSCIGCYFHLPSKRTCTANGLPVCSCRRRLDGRDVIFKLEEE